MKSFNDKDAKKCLENASYGDLKKKVSHKGSAFDTFSRSFVSKNSENDNFDSVIVIDDFDASKYIITDDGVDDADNESRDRLSENSTHGNITFADSGNSASADNIENLSDDSLEISERKKWFFYENIRLEKLREDLEKRENNIKKLREDLEKRENKLKNKLVDFELLVDSEKRREKRMMERLENNQHVLDEKWKILKRGFDELTEDRREFRKRQEQFEQEERAQNEKAREDIFFFRGIKDMTLLKKRYKDLMKVYHPDNIAGDRDIVLMINKEYEEMKRRL